jgi:aminocarboxymuconate-semialdehyde decarboxylase
MPTRREFVKTATGAAAGFFVQARPSRREVSIGRRRITVIDIHGHLSVPEVADIIKGTKLAPAGGRGGGGGGDQEGGLVLGPERLKAIDEQGIDVQVLSVSAFWYSADRELARQIVAVENEKLSAWCAAHPDRFAGLATVSLQFPDLAAEQLEHGIKKLGLRGAAIGGSVEGEELSSPKFDPFWAKAQELGALVFMHPRNAPGTTQNPRLRGRGGLGNTIGNPLETTVFLSHLIFDGTLDKFPGLRVCAAHAGGYLPSYLGRSEAACTRDPQNCAAMKRKFGDYFRDQILVDSMVFRDEGLRHLVAEMGARQIVYGTDMPFPWPVGVDFILRASFLSDADKEAILGGTLTKLLRIGATS